jgi:hypothetical protein
MINFPMVLISWLYFTVWLIDWWFKCQHSYLICSGAYPNSINAIQSTHYFQICIVNSITQLLIEIPERIGISHQITVIDQRYRGIDFVTYSTSTNLTIEFTQSISPGQVLSIAIHGIRNSTRSPQVWIYNLYSREREEAFTLLGVARIATYCFPFYV